MKSVLNAHADKAKEILASIASQFQRDYNQIRPGMNQFPHQDFMRPTSIGNYLSSLDDYAEKIYGIQTGVLWPKIWQILDENDRKSISSIKLNIHVCLNLSVLLSIGFILVGLDALEQSSIVISNNLSWQVNWKSILILVLILLFIRISYALALSYTSGFKEKIEILIDLKKSDFLSKIGIKVNSSYEERKIFKYLNDSYIFQQELPFIKYE